MTYSLNSSSKLPDVGTSIFLVGIGGIGMSALAQYLCFLGYKVSGSDRALNEPSLKNLYDCLTNQGIQLYPQDGSGPQSAKPDLIIYSTAVEEGNPDFAASAGIPRLHRSQAMAEAVNRSGLRQIAIAGSNGKTSVTGWIASALTAAGCDPVVINGGYIKEFKSANFPGNFRPGSDFVIYEADESDGSLVNFKPEIGILLSLGVDHYSTEKLEELFRTFLSRCQKVSVEENLLHLTDHLTCPTTSFGSQNQTPFALSVKQHKAEGVLLQSKAGEVQTQQWGDYSASNAAATWSALSAAGIADEKALASLAPFIGVERRFDYHGLCNKVKIYDDYAHNPQKIAACLQTLMRTTDGKIIGIFQPHGFGPLKFMRDALKEELQKILRPQDEFIFMPVFYAGGTTSFKPSSEEVVQDYQKAGIRTRFIADRDQLLQYLKQQSSASAAVLGARDPSLSSWAHSLVEEN